RCLVAQRTGPSSCRSRSGARTVPARATARRARTRGERPPALRKATFRTGGAVGGVGGVAPPGRLWRGVQPVAAAPGGPASSLLPLLLVHGGDMDHYIPKRRVPVTLWSAELQAVPARIFLDIDSNGAHPTLLEKLNESAPFLTAAVGDEGRIHLVRRSR